MKIKILMAFCLLLVLGLARAAEYTVEMKNQGAGGQMVFEPAVIKVAVGDTVNFVLVDMLHNSESVEGLTPEGSVTWKGEDEQEYLCHPRQGRRLCLSMHAPSHARHGRRDRGR